MPEDAPSDDAPENEDWAAVRQAIDERMSELRMSPTKLSRETGLSPNTIRDLGKPAARRRTQSTLVAISAVLEWKYDHLTNILHGEPQKNARDTSPLEQHFEYLLRAEVGPVKEEVAGIKETIHVIDQKIDVIIGARHSPKSAAEDSRPAPGQPPGQL